MKYVVHKYYSTFETMEIEADTEQEALSQANEQEDISTEDIMMNLERWEDGDIAHEEEVTGLCCINHRKCKT